MKHFPFKVINKGGKPVIQVEYRGETKDFVRNSFSRLGPPVDVNRLY